MPFRSEKQRRYIFMEAAAGKPWARKFITDSGMNPPPLRRSKRSRRKART